MNAVTPLTRPAIGGQAYAASKAAESTSDEYYFCLSQAAQARRMVAALQASGRRAMLLYAVVVPHVGLADFPRDELKPDWRAALEGVGVRGAAESTLGEFHFSLSELPCAQRMVAALQGNGWRVVLFYAVVVPHVGLATPPFEDFVPGWPEALEGLSVRGAAE